MTSWRRWQDWVAVVAGVYAFLSPIWTPTVSKATTTLVILGIVAAVVGLVSLAIPGAVADAVLPEDQCSSPAYLLDLHMLLTNTGGRVRGAAEWERLLPDRGFHLHEVIPTGLFAVLHARPTPAQHRTSAAGPVLRATSCRRGTAATQ